MKRIEVFEGHELKRVLPVLPNSGVRCYFVGHDGIGKQSFVPFGDDLLSRHLLFLGGIGTGKTNAIFQILSQLRKNMNQADVMVVFDVKGDFYREFYQ